MYKQKWKRTVSWCLLAVLTVGMMPAATAEMNTNAAAAEIAVAEEAAVPAAQSADLTWSYLDNNTDPAGDSAAEGYERTSWTTVDYNDSQWKTASGSFGSKKGAKELEEGYTADNLLAGCDGENDAYAYFFRHSFTVDNPADMKYLTCTLQYDDAATVYINGIKVAGYDDSEITANLQHGGSNASTPKTVTFTKDDLSDLNLQSGKNVLAVEIHQGRPSSSDVWFYMPQFEIAAKEPEVMAEKQSGINLAMGADESEMNFTWYTNVQTEGVLLLAKADEVTADTMPDTARQFEAEGKAAVKAGYYSYQTTATDLEENTTYAYQMKNGATLSDIHTFTTGGGDGFTFAFVGDPQIGASGNGTNDGKNWGKTLNRIATDANFAGTDFILSAGDQVNSATDETQYSGYLEHEELYGMPVATVVGNHDTASSAYNDHFHVANESETLGISNAGGDNYFVYHNTLFMVLNSNNLSTAEHKAFMEQAIRATERQNIRWKVVTFHHSIYSVASHAVEQDILARRNGLVPVFNELGIDVVLMGHDHVYVRSYIMDGLTPVTAADNYEYGNGSSNAPTAVTDPEGVLYVTANSASGSKYYSIQNMEFPYAAVKNQERTPNVSRVDVTDDSFRIITYRISNNELTVVDAFTINRSEAERDFTENVNTKSETGLLQYLDSYATGTADEDGGVAEIVKFNPENDCMYLVSGQTQKVDIAKIDENGRTGLIKRIDVALMGKLHGFSAGDITSVDVNPQRDLVAIAVQNSDYGENGSIVLLDYNGAFVQKFDAGVQPDMLTFTPDGSKILTANEGEPREGYGGNAVDPKGSVTVVDLDKSEAQTVTFEDLNREKMIADGVLLKKDASPAEDLEPEYIAVSADSKTAYVTLQENNAVAALDLTNDSWVYVKGLGFKDHSASGNGLDLDVDGAVAIRNESVYGVYMPDGIACATINGKDYLLTANEGDAREWEDYKNINSGKLPLSDGATAGKKIEYLKTDATDGLEEGKTYLLGGRSFSVWDAETLKQVYDSGDNLEQISAKNFPAYFNSGHDAAGELDKRSNKKGPEPESVATVTANGKTYAIVGLERMGGIMAFDISDLNHVTYADYLNVRDFTSDDLARAGDLGAEGICTVSADDSPTGNAMILVANEISGTVTVAQIETKSSSGGSSSGGSSSGGSSSSGSSSSGSSSGGSSSGNGSAVKPEQPKDEPPVVFADVNEQDWFYHAVQYMALRKLMSGTGNDQFSPQQPTNRAMMVTMLYRLAGEPEVQKAASFNDVPVGSYYADAVAWAEANGLTNGVGAGAFAPERVLSRQELASMLYRFAQFQGLDVTAKGKISHFADQPDSWARSAMEWCVGIGVINGTSQTTLSPLSGATRAQMAVIFSRFLQWKEA